jgi:hypothetical protein
MQHQYRLFSGREDEEMLIRAAMANGKTRDEARALFVKSPNRTERKLKRLRGIQYRPRIEARQRIILGGFVPAKVAAGYTIAQIAVLYVLAVEHQRHGCCKLTVGRIGYLAQCCETVVHNTLRQAQRLGDIQIKRRRVSRYYSLPNLITITNRTWLAWLRLGPRRSRPWGEGGLLLSSELPSAQGCTNVQRYRDTSAANRGRVANSKPQQSKFNTGKGEGAAMAYTIRNGKLIRQDKSSADYMPEEWQRWYDRLMIRMAAMFGDPDDCTREDELEAVEALAADGIHPPAPSGMTPYW